MCLDVVQFPLPHNCMLSNCHVPCGFRKNKLEFTHSGTYALDRQLQPELLYTGHPDKIKRLKD